MRGGLAAMTATPRPGRRTRGAASGDDVTTAPRHADARRTPRSSQLRLDGAIFLRAEFTEGWAYESPPRRDDGGAAAARRRAAHPASTSSPTAGAGSRSTMASGTGPSAGDVIVLPYGDQHQMGGRPRPTHRRVLELIDRRRGSAAGHPARRRAASAPTSSAATCTSDDPLFDPALRALPPVFVVRPDRRRRRPGCRRASRTRSAADPSARRRDDAGPRRGCPSCCSPRCCASTWRPRPRPTVAGSPRCTTRCSAPRWPLLHAEPARHWTVTEPRVARRGVAVAARRAVPQGARAARRSATSPTGACTSPRTCSPRPTLGVAADRPSRRLRLRGGVQPRVQAGERALTEPLARGALAHRPLTSERLAGSQDFVISLVDTLR